MCAYIQGNHVQFKFWYIKTAAECEIFKIFGQHDNKLRYMYTRIKIQDCHGHYSFQQQEEVFHQQIGLQRKKKLVKFYTWSMALYDAEIRAFRKVD
jgi:hypothetical protein